MGATAGGGGGGRILPGVGGLSKYSPDGDGGDANNPGENGGVEESGGGGGGWGSDGGDGIQGLGGAGGNAVVLNGFSVTWQGEFSTDFSNHIYGAVS